MDKGLQEFLNVFAGVFTDTLPNLLDVAFDIITLIPRLILGLLA